MANMQKFTTNNPELDSLFERYRSAPESSVFAPLADACRKAGMLEEAIEICNKGLKANPRYTSGYVVQGKCYFDANDISKASRTFSRVLELDPNNLVALRYLGTISVGEGNAAAAREHFQQILNLDPGDKAIISLLEDLDERPFASTSAQHGPDRRRRDRRQSDTLTVEGISGEFSDIDLSADDAGTAHADHDVDDVDESPLELRQIRDEDFVGKSIHLGSSDAVTSDELATLTLADIYAAQGYATKARRIYEEVLKRQPNNPDALRKLDALSNQVPATAQADTVDATVDETVDDTVSFPDVQDSPAVSPRQNRRKRSRRSGDESREEAAEAPAKNTTVEVDAVVVPEQSKTTPPVDDGTRIKDGASYEQFKRWLKDAS